MKPLDEKQQEQLKFLWTWNYRIYGFYKTMLDIAYHKFRANIWLQVNNCINKSTQKPLLMTCCDLKD